MNMSDPDEDLAAIFEDCPFPEWREFPDACGKCQTVWGGDAWCSYLPERERVDTAFVRWVWERGHLIHVVRDKDRSTTDQRDRFRAQLTPKTRGQLADECFHATSTCRAENIRKCGLFPGCECGRSQTRRLDASNYIHVSVALSDARDWAMKEKLLAINVPAILRIDLAAAGIGLLRDPFSSTGYILDTFHVEKQFIPPDAWEQGAVGQG